MHRISFTLLIATAFLGTANAEETAITGDYEDKVASALAAKAGGLTADAAASRAMANAPSVDVRAAEIELSKASQGTTLAQFVPQLTLTATATRNNKTDFDFGGGALSVGALNPGQLAVGACADGSGNTCVVDAAGMPVGALETPSFEVPRNNYSVVAQLNVPLSDYLLRLQPARRASAADLTGATHRRDDELASVGHQARIAFYEWLRAKAQLAVARESLLSVRARLKDAQVNLAGGTVAPADVLQVESLEASSQVAIVNAESFEELARQNLATLMASPNTAFEVGEDALGGKAPPIEGELKSLIGRAKKTRHDLRGLAAAQVSAAQAAKGASAGLYPRLDGFGSVTYANPNQQFFPPSGEWNASWSIGVSLSWGLDRYFTARSLVDELSANAAIFEAQHRTAIRGAELEVTAAWQEAKRAEASVKLSAIDQRASEAAYSQRVALYKGGEATTSEVIEAEVQRFNASLRSINARIDLRVAAAKLRRATGLSSKIGPPK